MVCLDRSWFLQYQVIYSETKSYQSDFAFAFIQFIQAPQPFSSESNGSGSCRIRDKATAPTLTSQKSLPV